MNRVQTMVMGLSGLSKLLGRRARRERQRQQPVVIEGIPDGISRETLNQICRDMTGSPMRGCTYTHVSGWKRAGAYRLNLVNARGREWQLIYKNAIYDIEHIPALEKFPVKPGIPEYIVYSNTRGALERFLPDVYLCREVIPGKHYQYLLEDLSDDFIQICNTSDRKLKYRVASVLPDFHEAMREWLEETGHDPLLRYDHGFSRSLRDYAGPVLFRLAEQESSDLLHEICGMWPDISGLTLDMVGPGIGTDAPVHGDSNGANILVHKTIYHKIKLIDWEWAGLGIELSDLVSLFRRSSPEVYARALANYSAGCEKYSPDMAARLYEWCRLERGILDAAYIAAQHMGSAELVERRQDWAPRFVDKSLYNVLGAYRNLAG